VTIYTVSVVLHSVLGVAVLGLTLLGLSTGKTLLWWLRAGIAVVAAELALLGFIVFQPLVAQQTVATSETAIDMPAYNYQPWHRLPVQYDGRVMPFETACRQVVKQITGRSKFQNTGKPESIDAVAVVLQWMFLNGTSHREEFVDWENYPFILCPHWDLRQKIYAHLEAQGQELTQEQRYGKYISPADLRTSKGFQELLAQAMEEHRKDAEKASQNMSPEMRKAEEVNGRLELFDSIAQNNPPGGRRMEAHPDPFRFVALDRVAGGALFSRGELVDIEKDPNQAEGVDPGKWREEMKDRLGRDPHLYIKPELQQRLRQFQDDLKAGNYEKDFEELVTAQQEWREKQLKIIENLQKDPDKAALNQFLFGEVLASEEDKEHARRVLRGIGNDKMKPEEMDAAILKGLRQFLVERDAEVLDNLRTRVREALKQRYHPEDVKYRMLHLDYLEARFPNVYRESAAWQKFPRPDVDRLLDNYATLREAYRSGDANQFESASDSYFRLLDEISTKYAGVYPGADTPEVRLAGLFHGRPPANPAWSLLDVERQYNRYEPFQWAWVLMLLSVAFFIGFLAVKSRITYWIGIAIFLASLGLQVFGFYSRIVIAGRPPVSNMYETLIWVPFMSSIFALALELVYRRGVIALAGGVVTTLGLIVSDQLPVELGAKISSLQPVLRSNYWLTIHVLTIVSSYAGGTLAWGLGNISLALLAFGNPRRDLLKTLAQFSYRAMQIAVLLLAAGTFLGGWWAADSWGRFWGWDPKEVWALIALVCYVIPLHMRYIGWVKDFGLAVSAVLCYAFIVFSWYGVNFVLAAGLHAYGFGSGSPWIIGWFALLNLEYVLVASLLYLRKSQAPKSASLTEASEQLVQV
jgi:ABC-type transport system involved in cytochrome c biogenesis permease subunit